MYSKVKILSALVGLSVVSTGLISASAYTGSKTDYNQPFTWNQTDQFDVSTYGPNGYDWRMASCMIQAAAFMKVKVGVEGIGYKPSDLKKSLDDIGGYTSAGYANYKKISFGKDWELVQTSDEHGYIEANYNDMIRYYNEGYLVFVRVQTSYGFHQIAIDHIDKDGNIYIFDSGFRGTKFTDSYSKSSVVDVALLKSKSGQKGYNLPTLYNQKSGQAIYEILEDNTNLAKTKEQLINDKEKQKKEIINNLKKTEELKKVELAVSNAENSKDKKQISYALQLVSTLDKELRNDFISRLNNIK